MISLLVFMSMGWGCWTQTLSSLVPENTIQVFDTGTSPLIPKVGSTTVNISVPYYKQPNMYYCGDACLEMVFDFYGENISQLEIADVARTVSPDGTWEDDMRRATHFSELSKSVGNEILGANITGYADRRYGYVAFEQRFTDAQNITQFIDAGYPLIVLMLYDYPNNAVGHFRVVTGYIAAEDGTVEKFIVHDPWNYTFPGQYRGPGVEIKYSNFTECWAWANNWSLFLCPWIYSVEAPLVVEVNVPFTVSAKLTNMCPAFGNSSAGNLTLQNATIQLPPGFELAGAETLTKTFGSSTIITNETSVIEWQVVGTVPGASGSFTINATSLVNGTTVTHPDSPVPGYFYIDLINGTGSSNLVTAQNVNPVIPSPPADISYEVETVGHNISWVIHDLSVADATYALRRNGVEVENRSWTSDVPIQIPVDGLSMGLYTFTLVVADGLGGLVMDEVDVSVNYHSSPPYNFGLLIGLITIGSIAGIAFFYKWKKARGKRRDPIGG